MLNKIQIMLIPFCLLKLFPSGLVDGELKISQQRPFKRLLCKSEHSNLFHSSFANLFKSNLIQLNILIWTRIVKRFTGEKVRRRENVNCDDVPSLKSTLWKS